MRRKLVSADINLKNTYPDQAFFFKLTRTLAKEFKEIKDGLCINNNMPIEDKLKEIM